MVVYQIHVYEWHSTIDNLTKNKTRRTDRDRDGDIFCISSEGKEENKKLFCTNALVHDGTVDEK